MSFGRMGRLRVAGVVTACCFGLGLLGAGSALAETETFTPEGGDFQTWIVPGGVTQVQVVSVGGAGEAGGSCGAGVGGSGGSGAKVTATMTVSAGEQMIIRFGRAGEGGASESCGGGAGGGHSEVIAVLSGALVVAGGGGGGGASFLGSGGNGGSAKALTGDSGLAGSEGPENSGAGGEGGEGHSGHGGEAGTSHGCEPGLAGFAEIRSGGPGGGAGPFDECAGGGGGGGGDNGGGGGGSGFHSGGGGGAGASVIASGATGAAASGAGEAQKVLITYTQTQCSGNTGTVTLSPGLTNTALYQSVKVKGTLTGCTGQAFTEAKYTAAMTTSSKVTCSALAGSGLSIFGAVRYTWTPKTHYSTGTLSMRLTEAENNHGGSAFASELEFGSFSPAALVGTVSESYTNGPICGVPQGKLMVVRPVTRGTFTGSAVTFE